MKNWSKVREATVADQNKECRAPKMLNYAAWLLNQSTDPKLWERAELARYQGTGDVDRAENRTCVLHPDGTMVKRWSLLQLGALAYVAIVLPPVVGLGVRTEGFFFVLELLVDLIFWIDIILNFTIAFRTSTGRLEWSQKLIALNYIKSWFFVDLIASLPYELVARALQGQLWCSFTHCPTATSLNVMKVTRVARLCKLFRLTRVVKVGSLYAGKLETHKRLFPIIKQVGILLLLGHISTCVFLFLTLNPELFGGRMNQLHPVYKSKGGEVWLEEIGIVNSTWVERYITAAYFSFATMSTVGYGEISGGTALERLFVLVTMCIGTFLFGMTIATCADLLANLNRAKVRKEVKIDESRIFIMETRLPKPMASKLLVIARSYQPILYDSEEIIRSLPTVLQKSVLQWIYQDLWLLFANWSNILDEMMVVELCLRGKVLCFDHDVELCEKDTVWDSFFIVCSGHCIDKDYRMLKAGSVFGIEFLHQQPNYLLTLELRSQSRVLELKASDTHFVFAAWPELRHALIPEKAFKAVNGIFPVQRISQQGPGSFSLVPSPRVPESGRDLKSWGSNHDNSKGYADNSDSNGTFSAFSPNVPSDPTIQHQTFSASAAISLGSQQGRNRRQSSSPEQNPEEPEDNLLVPATQEVPVSTKSPQVSDKGLDQDPSQSRDKSDALKKNSGVTSKRSPPSVSELTEVSITEKKESKSSGALMSPNVLSVALDSQIDTTAVSDLSPMREARDLASPRLQDQIPEDDSAKKVSASTGSSPQKTVHRGKQRRLSIERVPNPECASPSTSPGTHVLSLHPGPSLRLPPISRAHSKSPCKSPSASSPGLSQKPSSSSNPPYSSTMISSKPNQAIQEFTIEQSDFVNVMEKALIESAARFQTTLNKRIDHVVDSLDDFEDCVDLAEPQHHRSPFLYGGVGNGSDDDI